MDEGNPYPGSAFTAIRAIDYTVIFARDITAELLRKGVALMSPPTDQAFGHRTLFFRDPDGNLLEMFADIER